MTQVEKVLVDSVGTLLIIGTDTSSPFTVANIVDGVTLLDPPAEETPTSEGKAELNDVAKPIMLDAMSPQEMAFTLNVYRDEATQVSDVRLRALRKNRTYVRIGTVFPEEQDKIYYKIGLIKSRKRSSIEKGGQAEVEYGVLLQGEYQVEAIPADIQAYLDDIWVGHGVTSEGEGGA